MEFSSNKPNPKDFQDFNEYVKALDLHKKFIESIGKVSEVINESKTDEEERKAMEDLGFTYHEDFVCERVFCQEHEECLSTILDTIQFTNEDLLF
jgi:hypothetical protein